MSQIKLTADSGVGTTSLKAPSSTTSNADVVLKFPVADGSANQVLKTDGSGQLSFTSNAGTTINNNATTKFITGTDNANELDCEANLSYNNSVVTFSSSNLSIDKSTNPTVSAKETAGNKEVQLRANTTGGLLRTAGSYPLVLGTNQTERLRIDSAGQVYVGCTDQLSDYASDKTKLSIWHTGDSGGYLEIGGDQTATGYSAGTILFCNTNNSSSIRNVGMARAEIVTSDSNAGDDSGADLVLYTRAEAGNLNESFRIKSTRDVQITDGNLIVASGHGIDFSATGGPTNGSGSSELLDDYETGTWTPSVGTYGGVTGTRSFSRQDGYYVKIGRMVFCWMDWVIDSWSGGTGSATVYGLPFNKSFEQSLSAYYSGLTVWWASNTVTGSKANITGWIAENTSHYRLYVSDSGESSALGPNFTGRVSANFVYTTSS